MSDVYNMCCVRGRAGMLHATTTRTMLGRCGSVVETREHTAAAAADAATACDCAPSLYISLSFCVCV